MALALQLGAMLARPLNVQCRLGRQCKLQTLFNTFTTSAASRPPMCRPTRDISYVYLNSALKSLAATIQSVPLLHAQFSRGFRSFVRCFARAKRPFDVDSNLPHDVIVYSYKNDRFYKMLTIFGIIQFFFWIHLAGFCYRTLGSGSTTEKAEELLGKTNSWANIIGAVEQYRYRIAVVCLLLAYVVMAFAWFYPHRSITKLTLLKGGEALQVSTYTHFGRMRDFTIPLSNVSFLQTREAKATNLAMKIKGRNFYYLLDKHHGKFQEPELFDYVVGLKRELN